MSISPKSEAWLFELKHRKSFYDPIVDPSDPYAKAMRIFQVFTNSVINGIERKDANVLSLIDEGLLQDIYSNLPAFESSSFRLWVKDAMLKHPFRRTPKQYHFLAIVQSQNRGPPPSVKAKVLEAAMELDDWQTRVYAPANLVKDPDALYFFRNKNGIKEIDPTLGKQTDKACLICTNAFDTTLHLTQSAACGHFLCKRCFDKWLLECKGTYNCPLCRMCVVCGANDCKYHDIHQDRALPLPMRRILDHVILDKAGDVLHGIEARQYWRLREHTRKDRGMLAWIEELLASGSLEALDPVYVRLGKEAEEITARVADAVEAATV
jgi:hypothetical protein